MFSYFIQPIRLLRFGVVTCCWKWVSIYSSKKITNQNYQGIQICHVVNFGSRRTYISKSDIIDKGQIKSTRNMNVRNRSSVEVEVFTFLFFRFMPDGIYLNAVNYKADDLAREMNNIIQDSKRYLEYFKWHRHYSFHSTGENNYHEPVCGLCALLNNRTRRNQRTVYKRMTKWWNEGQIDKNVDVPIGMDLITDEEKSKADDNVEGFFSNLFNYMFGSKSLFFIR